MSAHLTYHFGQILMQNISFVMSKKCNIGASQHNQLSLIYLLLNINLS